MTYISDLNKLELDSYNDEELRTLALRIIKNLGAAQCWDVLEAASDKMRGEGCGLMIATRFNPDNPLMMDIIGSQPTVNSLEDFKTNNLLLLVRAAMMSGDLLQRSSKASGIGPMGGIELFQACAAKMSNDEGRDGNMSIFGVADRPKP